MTPIRSCLARARALCLLLPLLLVGGCFEYGPPVPTVVDRPMIAAPAAPVHEWRVDRVTVYYYWYKVNRYDIAIKARGYFPPDYKDAADAVWEVEFHTLETPDLPSVPGSFLGIWRSYVDASAKTQYEIVPKVNLLELNDGMYGVIESGVEFSKDDPTRIESIRPILHIRMIKEHVLDPYFDMPIYLMPVTPSALTPVPQVGESGNGPRGTPMNVPTAPPAGEDAKSIPIPGMPGVNP